LPTEKINSFGTRLSHATCQLLSRNQSTTSLPETDEEKLVAIIAPLRIALQEDLATLAPEESEWPEYSDENAYKNYKEELDRVTKKFQKVNKGFRRMLFVPVFMFAIVSASRVGLHFMHSPWFKTSMLSKMIDVHGGVSVERG
jgi:hypothetical protein